MTTPKLIALDMDGTLLDGSGQLPPGFDRVASQARDLGVTLAPASGRQLATLKEMFPTMGTFLAENGTVICHQGKICDTHALSTPDVLNVLSARQKISVPFMVILCTPEMAYVEKQPPAGAEQELSKYYKAHTFVDSLTDVVNGGATVIKIAIFCADGAEKHVAPILREVVDPETVAISGKVWVDCMAPGANKGVALLKLAEILGVNPADTCAFGDYLNDYELLQAAGLAIAMENAHPKLKSVADRIAPPNTDYGVITVLEEMLGQK